MDSFTIENSTVPPLKPTDFILRLDSGSGNELQFLQCHLNLLRMVGAIMPSNLKQMQSKYTESLIKKCCRVCKQYVKYNSKWDGKETTSSRNCFPRVGFAIECCLLNLCPSSSVVSLITASNTSLNPFPDCSSRGTSSL